MFGLLDFIDRGSSKSNTLVQLVTNDWVFGGLHNLWHGSTYLSSQSLGPMQKLNIGKFGYVNKLGILRGKLTYAAT